MAITVDVYDPDGTIHLGTLTEDFARQWRDAHNDPGSFGFQVPARGTDAALCAADNIVRFALDGTVRFAGVIGTVDRKSIDQGEEAAQLTTVNGVGVLGLLANAAVYPELGVNRMSPAQRFFGFMSSFFDDNAWTSAVEIKLQSDHSGSDVSLQWRTSDDHSGPSSWPDPSAWWIWSRAQVTPDDTTPIQPVGDSYFRRRFTLTAQTACSIFLTADDGFECYLDAGLIASETTAFMWQQTRKFDVLLDAGDHLVAVKATNMDRPDHIITNTAGLLLSVMEVDAGGEPTGTVIVNTDSSWVCADYPTPAPTMIPGRILAQLIDEAHTRGTISTVSYDFTDAADSNGADWATPVDVSYPVGTSILDVVRNLIGLAVDVRMDPAALTLHAYTKATMGVATGVTLEAGVHLLSLTHQSDPPLARDAIVAYHTGVWVEKTSGLTPRKEVGLSLGSAPSDGAVDLAVTAIFADSAQVKTYYTWTCLPVAGAAPYVNWGPGDIITLPDPTDTPATVTVIAVTVTEPSPSSDGVIGGTTLFAAEGE